MIQSLITTYTDQLEDYDKNSFSSCMSAVGFVGVIISAIAALLVVSKEANGTYTVWVAGMISALLLLIPILGTLCLYNFCMNCRRVAYFRGYLSFLEEELNKILGANIGLYNQVIDPQIFANFWVNKFGPVALLLFLILIYGASIVVAIYMVNGGFLTLANLSDMNRCVSVGYALVTFLVLSMSTIFSAGYILELAKNGREIKKVKQICDQYCNPVENSKKGGSLKKDRD